MSTAPTIDPGATRALLGAELSRLVDAVGERLVAARELTTLPAAGRRHASFHLRFADGLELKGRWVGSAEQAERVRAILESVDCPAFARILARDGAALLEEWVTGEPIGALAPDDGLLARCGAILGALHTAPVRPGLAAGRFDPASRIAHLDAQARDLLDRGLLAAAECDAIRSLSRRHLPAAAETGFIHRDLCAENLVRDACGRPRVIDNETVRHDVPDFDLARTWYRWPLTGRAWRRLLDGYREHRDAAAFLEHMPYWVLAVLVDTSVYRAANATGGVSIPLDRLRTFIARAPR